MRVNSIMPKISVSYSDNDLQYSPAASVKHQELKNLSIGFYNDYSIKPAQGFSVITFTGNSAKNMNQVASLCFENKGTSLPEDSQGGMGVVTMEGPLSMNEHERMDVRSFIPFHEYNNPKGGYKYVLQKDIPIDEKTGKFKETIEARWFRTANPGQTREELAEILKVKPEDIRFVIQSVPSDSTATGKSRYVLIDPTSVKGSFERMDDFDIGKTKTINYELFRFADDNPVNVKLKRNNYWVYTSEFAKTPKPYTYGPEGWGGMASEIINSDFCRAVAGAMKQMNTEEFGYFNPASIWGHDRTVAWFYSQIADASARGDNYFDGTISHHTVHNPRRTYQGFTYNPFEFARAIFSPEDVKKIAQQPEYELLQNFNARGWDNLTEIEKGYVNRVFESYIGVFKDYFGAYNVSKIPIIAKKVNPNNISVGTVSPGFEREMYDPNIDAAPGLGEDFRSIKMTSPLNGSTPANLHIDEKVWESRFGLGDNTLTARREEFTPIVYDGNNIEEVIEAREKNAVLLTDILKEAEAQGQDAVNRVYYNTKQIEEGRYVIGSISNYQKGDMLFVGWGRPDAQKGFPISVKGALEFFKRPDVPEEIKSRVHFLFGWGDLPFDKNSRDWKLITKYYNELKELENGKYARNMQLANGRFPNKLVNSASNGLLTSRSEMCGITPFEAWTAGVPCGTTATGGPNGYNTPERGWKTQTAPEMNPTYDGLTWDATEEEIDDARVKRSASETSDMIKEMSDEYFGDKQSYIKRCKKDIEALIDWHNNGELNGGKSANRMYIEDIWKILEGWGGRDKSPMRRLVGQTLETLRDLANRAPEAAETAAENLASQAAKSHNKWTQAIILTGLTLIGIGGGSYAYLKTTKPPVSAEVPQRLNKVA